MKLVSYDLADERDAFLHMCEYTNRRFLEIVENGANRIYCCTLVV